MLLATILGFMVQYLSGRLGTVTGKHLATLCREEYGDRTFLTIIVWIMAELAIIASDLAQILGAAFAWHILSYGAIPLWAGVIISVLDTFVLLAVQYFGIRYLEVLISLMVGVVSVCFFIELGLSPVNWVSAECPPPALWCSSFPGGVCPHDYENDYCGFFFQGFVPKLDSTMFFTALSLFGSVVMPHNLYLHSGLALVRC